MSDPTATDNVENMIEQLRLDKKKLEHSKQQESQNGTGTQSRVKQWTSQISASDRLAADLIKTQPELRKKRNVALAEMPGASADHDSMLNSLLKPFGPMKPDDPRLQPLKDYIQAIDRDIQTLKADIDNNTDEKAKADAKLDQAKIEEKRAETNLNTAKAKLVDLPKTIQTTLDTITALRANARTALDADNFIDAYIYLSDLQRNIGQDSTVKDSLAQLIKKEYEKELLVVTYEQAWTDYTKAVTATANASTAVDTLKSTLDDDDKQLKDLVKERDNRIKFWYSEHKDEVTGPPPDATPKPPTPSPLPH